MSLQTRNRWKPALLIALLIGIVILGVLVRWEDPASSNVIPAEDPYTHMALVRGHLADGNLDALVQGGELYPPGMHAVLATAYAFTGMDLSALFRFGPVVFGAVSIIGIAALLWRYASPSAAVVGSLGMALAPELVFRTTMMAPTALDLALIPFLLVATFELMRGQRGWGVALGVGIIFLIIAHPWALIVLAPVMLGIVLAASVLGRPLAHRSQLLKPLGAGIALVIVGVGLFASTSICWSPCGLGFRNIGATGSSLSQGALFASVGTVVASMVYFLAAWFGRRVQVYTMPRWLRPLLSVGLVLAMVGISIPAARAGLPDHVDLVRMFGWPLLLLAGLGLAMVPLVRWRAGWAGLAVVLVTYPFVIFNPLDSPFWPHRTAAYLGIGLVLLAGVGAASVVVGARQMGTRLATTSVGSKVGAATTLAVLAFVLTASSVYAGTPPTYETGWYRLYQECEFDAIKEVAEGSDAQTIIITGDWRTKLVAAAFVSDSERVWFSESFFLDVDYRERTTHGLALDGREVLVIQDRHMMGEHPEYDVDFLQGPDWTLQSSSCSEGLGRPRVSVYASEVQA